MACKPLSPPPNLSLDYSRHTDKLSLTSRGYSFPTQSKASLTKHRATVSTSLSASTASTASTTAYSTDHSGDTLDETDTLKLDPSYPSDSENGVATAIHLAPFHGDTLLWSREDCACCHWWANTLYHHDDWCLPSAVPEPVLKALDLVMPIRNSTALQDVKTRISGLLKGGPTRDTTKWWPWLRIRKGDKADIMVYKLVLSIRDGAFAQLIVQISPVMENHRFSTVVGVSARDLYGLVRLLSRLVRAMEKEFTTTTPLKTIKDARIQEYPDCHPFKMLQPFIVSTQAPIPQYTHF